MDVMIHFNYSENNRIAAWQIRDEPLYWQWGDIDALLPSVVKPSNPEKSELDLHNPKTEILNQVALGYKMTTSINPERLTFCTLAYYNDYGPNLPGDNPGYWH